MLLRLNPKVAAFNSSRIPLFPANAATAVRCISITSSPATAASALVQSQENKSLEDLHTAVQVFNTREQAINPADIFSCLKWVDTLQRLGVDRYMQPQIDAVLQNLYRLWQQKEEQIFSDPSCLAMAFRILRMKGYSVTPDVLGPYTKAGSIDRSGISAVLELYRASQVRVEKAENILERINAWTTKFLKQELQSNTILDKKLENQVEFELKNFHGILDRVRHRRNIELYGTDDSQSTDVYNEDLLLFSRKVFNICQAQHRKELEPLERYPQQRITVRERLYKLLTVLIISTFRWYYADCKLDSMKYGRNVLRTAHFLSSAIMADPGQSHALAAYAKHIVLITILDDFFDHHGSRDDSLEIIDLIREWKPPSSITYCNKEVQVMYTALFNTLTELATTAYPIQGRDITNVLRHLWVEILTCFMKEMDSLTDENAPSMDEYMSFAWITIGCRLCVVTSIHFLGVKLSEEVIFSSEYTNLCRHAASICRLLNDIQTFEKEKQERKVNSVSLQLLADRGVVTEEEACSKVLKMVEYHRRELLRLVLQSEGSIVPKECKDIFWISGKIGYYLYSSIDEFTSPQQMKEDAMSLIFEPLELPFSNFTLLIFLSLSLRDSVSSNLKLTVHICPFSLSSFVNPSCRKLESVSNPDMI